jgi:hypothetical protein
MHNIPSETALGEAGLERGEVETSSPEMGEKQPRKFSGKGLVADAGLAVFGLLISAVPKLVHLWGIHFSNRDSNPWYIAGLVLVFGAK